MLVMLNLETPTQLLFAFAVPLSLGWYTTQRGTTLGSSGRAPQQGHLRGLASTPLGHGARSGGKSGTRNGGDPI